MVEYDLPSVPEYFILTDPREIEEGKKIYPYPSDTFSSWTIDGITDELEKYLRKYFNYDIQVRYQIITGHMPIHIDEGREFAFNYLVRSGGENIATNWWHNGSLVYKKILKNKKWYKLNVSIPHNVDAVNHRISLSVKKATYD